MGTPSQVIWSCRRGMLELDLLLEPFASACYSTLRAADQTLFRELLEISDPQLWDWLLCPQQCSLPRFVPLLEAILDHARARR